MAFGDQITTAAGGVYTEPPTHCPNGHELGPNRVLVGSYPCTCGTRHMSWACRTCDAERFHPPKTDRCS